MAAVVLRVVFSLAFVVGLVYLTGFALKLYCRHRVIRVSTGSAMRLLETLPLGGGRALHLIALQSHMFLIGTSTSTVAFLCHLNGEEAQDLIKKVSSRGGSANLAQRLSRMESLRVEEWESVGGGEGR